MRRLALFGLLAVLPAACEPAPEAVTKPDPAEETPAVETPEQVFTTRILPIFKSPNPSSCVQCHLVGVDLKQYILPSSEKTFLSLRDQGLVDLDRPEDSKILQLIDMHESQREGANLIHEKRRTQEYEAFKSWVTACCRDPELRDAEKLPEAEQAGPSRPDEVIRHARKDRVTESFERTIWAMRFRCLNCHGEGKPNCDRLVEKFGDQVAWLRQGGPEETLKYLTEESDLIDARNPSQSILVLKPLNAVKHGGGQKIVKGGQDYKAFRTFLEDYAAVVKDRYREAADLPDKDSEVAQFGSLVWLKIAQTPPAWGDKLLEVRVYRWAEDQKGWETQPIATADHVVFGKGRLWQSQLTLLAKPGTPRAKAMAGEEPTLPAGRYKIRAFLDGTGKLGEDWSVTLGEDDVLGEAEISSRWPVGAKNMTVIDAKSFRSR